MLADRIASINPCSDGCSEPMLCNEYAATDRGIFSSPGPPVFAADSESARHRVSISFLGDI